MNGPEKASVDVLVEQFGALLREYAPIQRGRGVNPVDAFFVYRLLLGRNPDPHSELPTLLEDRRTFRELLDEVLSSREFSYSSGFFPPNHLLMSEVEGFRFWFNSSDREMGVVMALGMYEPEEVALMKRLIRPGNQCLDVGAQTGFYTCLMASLVGPSGQVHAFEPMPTSFAMLSRNIAENDFQDGVSARQLACSDAAATIQASRVSNMYIAGDVAGTETVSMETVRVDDLIQGPIDVIKIDVEGHEPAAIRGMQKLIRASKPVIISECNEYWLRTCSGSSSAEYVAQLNALGYEVFDVKRPGMPLAAGSLTLDATDIIDVVAIPTGDQRLEILQ